MLVADCSVHIASKPLAYQLVEVIYMFDGGGPLCHSLCWSSAIVRLVILYL